MLDKHPSYELLKFSRMTGGGTNYLVDVQALDNRSIEEDMKIYDFLFKDRSV